MRIDERFSGFPEYALGGYVAGMLARALGASAIEVRLERPVRLGDDVAVDGAALVRGAEHIATARPIALELRPPRTVTRAEAEVASARYPGATHHFFPRCFCCGPARAVGDGLRIFTGPLEDGLVAATWRPSDVTDSADVPAELLWSALDCPGIWAQVLVTSGTGEKVVSGSLAVARAGEMRARDTHVIVAWPIGREGRKIFAGAAVLSEHGDVLAVGRHTLIVTDRGVPLDVDIWRSAPAPSGPSDASEAPTL